MNIYFLKNIELGKTQILCNFRNMTMSVISTPTRFFTVQNLKYTWKLRWEFDCNDKAFLPILYCHKNLYVKITKIIIQHLFYRPTHTWDYSIISCFCINFLLHQVEACKGFFSVNLCTLQPQLHLSVRMILQCAS